MTYPPQVRGNEVDSAVLSQLVPGTSTRADVTALIGSPTAHATFDDNTWLYIGQVTKPEIAATNGCSTRRWWCLTFDQQGVLRSIQQKGRKDSVAVAMVNRTTPAPGGNASFLSQLLGNIGKFSPAPVTSGGTGTTQTSGRPTGNY